MTNTNVSSGKFARREIWLLRALLAMASTASLLAADAAAPTGNGPTAPTSAPSTTRPTEETVQLSPFEVRTDKDTSYGALNSNAISAINMELFKTPVAADIFTEQFMNDVATTSVEDLLNNYGAGVGQVLATPDSDSNNNQPGDRFSVAQVGSRGLTAGATRRDGFNASSTRTSVTDTFDTERVEVIKGANALLFGASGAGGFANTGSKTAHFGTNARPNTNSSIESRIDQFGSQRWVLDTNYGLKNVALRFVALDEDQNYRRLYIGSKTKAYYGALALRLPHNTLVKLNARRTDNDRIIPSRIDNLSFTNATRDPRHNYSLMYMLATNKAGANDPVTGAAYPGGPIVNGLLDWDNVSSWSGWTQSEDINTETYTITADTVWTKWLATSFGAMYEFSKTQRGPDGGSLMAPRAFNTSNRFDEWANSSSFRMDRNAGRRHAYRGSAVITNDLFHGRAHSQTILGYDLNFNTGGRVSYRYYEADANFRIYDSSNPRPAGLGSTVGGTSAANQLGRWELGSIQWPVGSGPVKKPGFRIGSRNVTIDGRNYVLEQQNPTDPSWVTPLNPLGLATLTPGLTGVGGDNLYLAEDDKNWGAYGANYTNWMDDRLTTLVGYRLSHTFSRRPNTSTSGTVPWRDNQKDNSSFNVGFNYLIQPWLYGYYNVGQTFDPAKGSNDPYGNAPKDTEGFSQEIGFKYQPRNGRISGSLTYYRAQSKNENFNYGTGNRDLINPVGINDAYNSATRNQWVNLDKESSGIELILTAQPTKNWRSRLGFTQQDGKIKTASSFGLLWNDEFYYNKATGGVTYADGSPFMVPTDATGVAAVNRLSALAAPVTGATNTQLTIGMLSDPNSDYYAYGKGGAMSVNGRITNNSVAFRALRWFQTTNGSGQAQQARTLRAGLPVSDIPYAFTDPIGYKGIAVLSEKGEPTIGHPLYRFVFTNTYDITETFLRGTTIGATVRWDIDKRTYWYSEPDGKGGNVRKLYKEVDVNPQVNSFVAYRRKFGRFGFRSQVNINNMFNKYKVDLRPDVSTGFTQELNIGATFVGQPREYVWTNTISF